MIVVDCHNAGKGDLEVFIDFRGTKVPCSVKETQTGVYTASYLPYICGVYSVRVSFNKSEIRGNYLHIFLTLILISMNVENNYTKNVDFNQFLLYNFNS